VDEAGVYGNILNLCCLTGKPVTYLTTGQNVPDDIETAEKDKIARFILDETCNPLESN
jgi:flagellar biosynthesis protein FlhF